MPVMKGLLAPQNTFLDTIATRFDGTRKCPVRLSFSDKCSLCDLVVQVADLDLAFIYCEVICLLFSCQFLKNS